MLSVKLHFKNPKFNFYTTITNATIEEIKADLIGSAFDFSFKGGDIETCIDVKISTI